MKPWIGRRIFRKSLIPFLIKQPHPLRELFLRHIKTIVIDEIIPRIIRRIDIDHLHLPQVRLLQELQCLQIIPFDIEILRLLPVLALLGDGAQGLADRAVRLDDRLFLPDPGEFIDFIAFDTVRREQLLQGFEIHAARDFPLLLHFGGTLGEEGEEFLYVLFREVGCFHFHFIHS